MNFKQSFKLAAKGLAANKMRSFLTMLGIIIGVASVIVLVSMVNGMTNTIVEKFDEMGKNLINVTVIGRGSSRTVTPEEMIEFAGENKELLLGCSPTAQTNMTVKVDNENISTTLLGVSEAYDSLKNLNVTEGRFLEFVDVDRKQKVCVVGTYIVKQLYGGKSPVGENLKIGNDLYRVVGVLEEKADGKEGTEDDKVIIPYTNATKYARIASYVFSAADENRVDEAANTIERKMYKIFNNSDYYKIISMDEMLDMVNEMTDKMTMILVGVAGISLLVGGIGIMNIMLVSVTERTKEIGIRKSLGAKQMDIMSQFVVEAATTSGIGGIIGIVLGAVMALVAGRLMDMTAYPSVSAILIAFSVSAIIGITFGYFPAKKAAKLNPIDALRYD